MASSVLKHRFQNSLDMVAARSMRSVERFTQSATGDAWGIMDSPTLGSEWTSVKAPHSAKTPEVPGLATSLQVMPLARVAPLNIKKVRRRGLASSVSLALPPSPLPLPPAGSASFAASASSSELAFTAEWDLTEKTFIFTPLDSSYPSSAASSSSIYSPIPVDVEAGSRPLSPALSSSSDHSPPALDPHPVLSAFRSSSDIQGNAPAHLNREGDESSSSSASSPVSSIFDRESLYSGGQKSRSTAASSVVSLVDIAIQNDIDAHGPCSPCKNSVVEVSSPKKPASPVGPVPPVPSRVLRKLPTPPRPRTQLEPQESQAPARRRRLPDVPRNASIDSMYSMSGPVPPVGRSVRRQLSAQFSKALSGSLFKR